MFDRWPAQLLGWLLLAAVALNFANIVGRYVFGWAIVWTEVVLVVWLAWSVFIGVVVVTYRGQHLAMDLVSSGLRGRLRKANYALMFAVLAGCLAYAALQSAKVVLLMVNTGQTHPSIGFPLWVPNLAILAGLALSLCALLVTARAYIAGRR
ncbi:MAG TPA: TRAP transporter small permease subunit [Burkholderiales bacterium]|nr:TRAP transporter small permease subunit [Burkholderiales bacterium]